MSGQKKVTIRQVADAAGVSPATVSLVFNEKGKVAAETRERVLEVGERLGYRPGWISKVFRSGRTFVLGVVVGHSGTPIWEQTYLPYYRGIIAGAAMEALNFGYSITVMPVTASGELGGPMRPDGIILVDPGPEDALIQSVLEDGIAVVTAGGHITTHESPRLRAVLQELDKGIPEALDALIDAGAQKPGFFRGPAIDAYTLESERSYLLWCETRGIDPLVFVLRPGQDPLEGARELISGAHGTIDGVYCINETYSSAMTAIAGEIELEIPGDFPIAVAGELHSGGVDPRLVYFDLNPIELGAACARLLVKILEGGSPGDVRLPRSNRHAE